MTQVAPYGSWSSPVSAAVVVEGAVSISEVQVDGDDVYWAEVRPSEGGRTAIVARRDGDTVEVTPEGSNVRTLVHEYGGGAWVVDRQSVFWSSFADQRLRRTDASGSTMELTPDPDVARGDRYADGRITPDGAWFIGVRERHRADGSEAVNEIVAVATDGSQQVEVLVTGPDFCSSPRIDPSGTRLAWLQWDHPNMPWDDTSLWLAPLDLADPQRCAIGDRAHVAGFGDEAIVQPEWSPSGELHYLSDRRDLWSLYRLGEPEPVAAPPGDIGETPWVFGQSRYAFTDSGAVLAVHTTLGADRLPGAEHYTSVESLRARGEQPVFVGASWSRGPAIVVGDEVVSAPRRLGVDEELLRAPEPMTFETGDGELAHALYFAPANPGYRGPTGERPPLVVMAHGGPTGRARTQLNLAKAFWTSRGFGVVDVDYRGSAGYGRAYRNQLDDRWGIADVEDCVTAARHLVDRGDVDARRLVIRGGSAGGFTVLCALAFHDVFAAGASLYGVSDLEALAVDTHKFESRYLDGLVGRYPEDLDVYRERSPIEHLDGFETPMIVLQGSDDVVVPPSQSQRIVAALEAKGVPVAYLEFAGEQHGFRNAPNIVRALEAELWFYGAILGFEVADRIDPVEILGDVGDVATHR